MTNEQALRDLGQLWATASERGDVATLLSLVADDVVFIVPGQKPFGKEAFAESIRHTRADRIQIQSELLELTVLGDWAWMRSHLDVTATAADGDHDHRIGDVLRILRKTSEGRWVITRDTSLLMPLDQ